jgi:hypothetical protein
LNIIKHSQAKVEEGEVEIGMEKLRRAEQCSDLLSFRVKRQPQFAQILVKQRSSSLAFPGHKNGQSLI